jgi:predicted membrane chloride channel (bestrophin family)
VTPRLGGRIAFPFVTFIAIILFGMDAVAREIQDPFGFDDNDLNVQGCLLRPTFPVNW